MSSVQDLEFIVSGALGDKTEDEFILNYKN